MQAQGFKSLNLRQTDFNPCTLVFPVVVLTEYNKYSWSFKLMTNITQYLTMLTDFFSVPPRHILI